MQFIINNWYLFLALAVVLGLLVAAPVRQRIYGIKNVSPADAIRIINRESGMVVDVREPQEFKTGRIPNAINTPLSGLPTYLKQLEKYKSRPLIISCATGNRSLGAAVTLRKHGFGAVHVLAGGLSAWQRDNLPVEK